MQIEYDSDGMPICPECRTSLHYAPAGNRDTETMGGYSVEYFRCPECGEKFEIINDDICPTY